MRNAIDLYSCRYESAHDGTKPVGGDCSVIHKAVKQLRGNFFLSAEDISVFSAGFSGGASALGPVVAWSEVMVPSLTRPSIASLSGASLAEALADTAVSASDEDGVRALSIAVA